MVAVKPHTIIPRRKFFRFLLAVSLVPLIGTGNGCAEEEEMQTLIDEVRRATLKVAKPHLSKGGVELNQDVWDNVLETGKSVDVKLHMFKGNDYYVWFGVDQRSLGRADATFVVLNSAGKVVPTQVRREGFVWEAHFTAPQTGEYRVRVSIGRGAPLPVPVVVMYGYR